MIDIETYIRISVEDADHLKEVLSVIAESEEYERQRANKESQKFREEGEREGTEDLISLIKEGALFFIFGVVVGCILFQMVTDLWA